MRTVGALREDMRLNRRRHRNHIRELLRRGFDVQEATRRAGDEFDAEYRLLERNIEFMKVPGNRRGTR